MSIDRPDIDADERADRHQSVTPSADQVPDMPHMRRPADADGTVGIGKGASFRVPTAAERIEAHGLARQAADAADAAWNRRPEGQADAATEAGTSPHPDTTAAVPEARNRERADDSDTSRSPDKLSATEDALRKRVGELEADKAARDQQVAIQDAKLAVQAKILAEQAERIDRLEAYVARITTAVRELRQQDEPRASADIAGRARGGEAERAEWQEPQHKRRLPTDARNNVISVAAGGVVTDLAYHLRDLPMEYAGIGASGVALGAGVIAVWRERRKAGDDADHRPKD